MTISVKTINDDDPDEIIGASTVEFENRDIMKVVDGGITYRVYNWDNVVWYKDG
jgi:hypothetical protein